MEKDKNKMTFNERLALAGIKTLYDEKPIMLEYNGKRIVRPDAGRVVEICLTRFGLEI